MNDLRDASPDPPPPRGRAAGLFTLPAPDESLGTCLSRIALFAVWFLPGCHHAGVMVCDHPAPVVFGHSDRTAEDLDEFQKTTGEGPSSLSLSGGDEQRADFPADNDAWPDFAKAAAGKGVACCCALPLALGATTRTFGVLTVYSGSPGALGGGEAMRGRAFASNVAFAVANALAYVRNLREAARLRAVVSRPDDVVAQATGVLMQRHGSDAAWAFRTLRDQAVLRAMSVEDVSRELLRSFR